MGILVQEFEKFSSDVIPELVECFSFEDMIYINSNEEQLIM